MLEGIRRKEKRQAVRENFLETIPLIHDHFQGIQPDFVNKVSTRLYPIGRGIDIPFTPPLVYGVGGQIYFPWFSFWRTNPLPEINLRLFVTIVDEVLRDDPDLEDAKFEILDFSAPAPSEKRFLEVIDAAEIEPLGKHQKLEMLEVFADGYLKALSILEAEPERESKEGDREGESYSDGLQLGLFD